MAAASSARGLNVTGRMELGVDVGGTFTDLALAVDGRLFFAKILTTPEDPSEAIQKGLEWILKQAGVRPRNLSRLVHGTTLVGNAITERRGALTALLTTRGTRDIVEIGESRRYARYDLGIERPRPLAARWLRREVSERVLADGSILEPLDLDQVRRLLSELVTQGVESLAISLLHSYRNPVHEQAIGKLLETEFPGLDFTLSHEVAPDIREFERTSTALANAYVRPRVRHYLGRLETRLLDIGVRAPLQMMLSSGGVTTVSDAQAYPIRLVESGPAAGAVAAAHFAAKVGEDRVVGFDMGGTTAKVCLLRGGEPTRSDRLEVARVHRFRRGSGLPLLVPSIELLEIGAGGGSIAWIDSSGLLNVGPRSAGAIPGPACYGRGGAEPTVTDADLLLGWLDAGSFLGGEAPLDPAAAKRVIRERIAQPLGISVERAAAGIVDVVNTNMAIALRVHVTERGLDPREMALVAFGGAGPAHAYEVARHAGLRRVIVPPGAGVASSIGLLAAPPAIEFVRAYPSQTLGIKWEDIDRALGEMETEARGILSGAVSNRENLLAERFAEMRFVGQGFEVPVPMPISLGCGDAARADSLERAFHVVYRERFGLVPDGVATELIRLRIRVSGPAISVPMEIAGLRDPASRPRVAERDVYFPELDKRVRAPVFNRYALTPSFESRGPAIVEERETTTVVGPRARLIVEAGDLLVVTLE